MNRRGDPTESPLEAVAGSFVNRPLPRALVALIAGTADPLDPIEAAEGLARAAHRLHLPVQLPEPTGASSSPEAGVPFLFVGNLGSVSEPQLNALAPPSSERVDLLLWMLPSSDRIPLRCLYLLGLCVWSFRPRRLRCLLPPGDFGRTQARERLVWGMGETGGELALEVLARPGAWREPTTENLLDQILMSALAASPLDDAPVGGIALGRRG